MPLKLRNKLDSGTIPTINRWADYIETLIGKQSNDIAYVKTTANAASGGSGAPAIALETNGSANLSQTVLNIENGTGVAVTNPSGGNVQISLPASGVSAGSYTLSDITVNAEGIITAASNGTVAITGGVLVKTSSYLTSGSDAGKLIAFNTNAATTYSFVNDATGSTSATFGTAPSSGNLVIAAVASSSATAVTLAGVANSWTALQSPVNAGDGFYTSLFYGLANGTQTTVTATGQGGSFPGITVYNFSGAPASPTATSSSGTGTGTVVGTSVTVSAANSLLVLWARIKINTATGTTTSPFVVNPASGSSTTWFVYGVEASTGSLTAPLTLNSSQGWGSTSAAFTPQAGTTLTLTLPASPPSSTWSIFANNTGVGTLTINPNGLLLNGVGSNITCAQNVGHYITTDGTNYFYV